MNFLSMPDRQTLYQLKCADKAPETTVFIVPGAGDGVTSFITLANALPKNFEVFGFQQRGLDTGERCFSNLESLVDDYFNSLPKDLSSKKICLIGHSFGAYVSLHLSERLHDIGIIPSNLILLDSYPPDSEGKRMSRIDKLERLIEILEMNSGRSSNIVLSDLAKLDSADQVLALHTSMVHMGLLPETSKSQSIEGMVNTFLVNCDMTSELGSVRFNGSSLLINASESSLLPMQRVLNYEQWKKYVPRLRYHECSGNHATMLREPNVSRLASIIREITNGSAPHSSPSQPYLERNSEW